jgi:hypothetical protein
MSYVASAISFHWRAPWRGCVGVHTAWFINGGRWKEQISSRAGDASDAAAGGAPMVSLAVKTVAQLSVTSVEWKERCAYRYVAAVAAFS